MAIQQVDLPDQNALLQMRSISKTFGSTKALTNVSLSVVAGELHALMGENGAGKSTLIKILSGAYVPDPGGEILFDAKHLQSGDPIKSRTSGIAVIYQELSLAPNLTVAQNMFLGIEPARFGISNQRLMQESAGPILARLGAPFSAGDLVSSLSLGERQMVEIARALTTNARIIVMDEPTTSLSSHETERLFKVIETLKSHGISIIYISHRMEEVYFLADRVSVLRDGCYVGTLSRNELSEEKLISMMVGRDLSSFYKKEHSGASNRRQRLLSVVDLGDGKRISGCSFDAYAGEVLGIAGLVGAGRTELARLIFGADRKATGRVVLGTDELAIESPKDALDAGIAYLTEDRKGLGLFLDMSVSDNVNVSIIARDAKVGGVLDLEKAKVLADRSIKAFAIRTDSMYKSVGLLSGGNQQKALIARILASNPQVVIFDEPTRGVDVGAKSEIYRIINELAVRGIAIIVISSDLPEIIGICDRAIVMREGRIVGEVKPDGTNGISQEAIMKLSAGLEKAA